MPDRRYWRHFDYLLVVILALVLTGGVAMVFSAARGDPQIASTPVNQAITAIVGFVALALVAIMDYQLLGNLSRFLYGLTVAALALVLVVGTENFGARRWFNLGGFDLQPGEIAKLAMVVVIANFISSRQGKYSYISTIILSGVMLAPVILLILLEPNMSTALTILFVWMIMIFVGGLGSEQMPYVLSAGIVLVVMVVGLSVLGSGVDVAPAGASAIPTPAASAANPAATPTPAPGGFSLVQDYQIKRVQQLLFGAKTPGETYQADQALIALGSGGLFGQGFLQGQQSQLRFLPVRHTDFIFSVIGEELGLVGCCLFIALIMGIVLRSFRAAWISRDTFGQLLCTGVGAIIFLQTYINLGMQVQMLPVTGVVLPFVSYGRSNLIALMAALGIVESVVMRHRRLEF